MKLKNNNDIKIVDFNKNCLPIEKHIEWVHEIIKNTFEQNPETFSIEESLSWMHSFENIIKSLKYWENSENRKTCNIKLRIAINSFNQRIIGYIYSSERNYLNSEKKFDELINFRVLKKFQWLWIGSSLYKLYDKNRKQNMQYLLTKKWTIAEKIYEHYWFEEYDSLPDKPEYIHMIKYD